MFKSTIILSSFLIILISFNDFHILIPLNSAFSQISSKKSIDKISSWISKKDNLNITIKMDPEIPIVDKSTKNLF